MSQNPPFTPGGRPPGVEPRKTEAKKTPMGKRSYTLKLSFSMLLTAVIVSTIGICWIFMLGVMVGRGYNPDAKVHEVASRLLSGNRTAPAPEPPQTVLKPEDLDFIPALRDTPRLSLQRNATAAQPAHSATAARPATGAESLPEALQTAAASPQPAVAAHPIVHDYVYQVATFKDSEQADKLREILEGEGLRTRLEKTPTRDGKGVFYKVQTLLRGDEDDNRHLLASLERLRLGLPLLRSKNPVKSGTEKR